MNQRAARDLLREAAKLRLRTALGRFGLDIGRDPYVSRLARALEAHGVDTVLDVGANVGQFAALLRAAGYPGRIVSIEPLTTAYHHLARRCVRDPRWSALNVALGAHSGESSINVSANSYSSSVLPMMQSHLDAAPDSVVVGTQAVRLSTVAEVVADCEIDPRSALLKIDTQGYESEVLAGAGDLLDDLRGIQLELSFVELYQGQQLFDELVAKARHHGLELWSLDPGISGRQGRLLQCDGLFMRTTA